MTEERTAENGLPVCRVCHIKSLSKYERTRAWDEPVTGCIYLCPEHQAAEDAMLAAMPRVEYIKAKRPEQPYVFPPTDGGAR